MKLALLLLLTVCHTCYVYTATIYDDVFKQEWNAFKLEYGKSYTAAEDLFRMKVFMENKLMIARHNQLYATGEKSYDLRMNQFGDMLHYEYTAMMNGFKRNYEESKYNGSTFLPPSNIQLPASVDWRTMGYVTAVKDQGPCGSCWAFSATGALEGQHFRKTSDLVILSEQNLIDCSSNYGNDGCEGGSVDDAFTYIRDNHGIDTEESYPYVAKDEKCHFKYQDVGATVTGFASIPSGNEWYLQVAVATVGPISVAIDASHPSFVFYHTGVYYEPHCNSTEVDHAVLVVGYGVTDKGENYWLVKNSYSSGWGEQGYIRMTKNRNDNCGIASYAIYPLV